MSGKEGTVPADKFKEENRHEMPGQGLDLVRDIMQKQAIEKKQSAAKIKGQERMQAADRFRKSDIDVYKNASSQNFQRRYKTVIVKEEENEFDIKTYVAGTEKSCYWNCISYNEENKKWTFYGMDNFKRRPPTYAEEMYPRGCGKFDEEVQKDNTQPLPHEQIVWNQISVFNQKKSVQAHLETYIARDITNEKDRKLIDMFLPNAGSKRFNEGENGYFSILGADTAKAKLNLGILFEKRLSSITLEKEEDGTSFIYSITYTYDKLSA
jgi:hypothetical protein